MTSDPRKLEALRSQLSGALILPGHTQFQASREIWNLCFDRRPSVIVRRTSAADVVAAVRFAREHDLDIAIKGGGHHAAGYASTDGGLLLDLSGLRGIEVDPEQRYAVAQAGLTWAHFDQVTQAFGLACTGPIVSMTGIAGFTLGGDSAGCIVKSALAATASSRPRLLLQMASIDWTLPLKSIGPRDCAMRLRPKQQAGPTPISLRLTRLTAYLRHTARKITVVCAN
jgi:hypothetical protein